MTLPFARVRESVDDVETARQAGGRHRRDAVQGDRALVDLRVLVVDDDQPTREAVQAVLQHAGAFIRKLRAKECVRGSTATPALALTAFATEEDRDRARAAGFQLHVAKPVTIERLRDAVRDLSVLAASSVAQASSSFGDA